MTTQNVPAETDKSGNGVLVHNEATLIDDAALASIGSFRDAAALLDRMGVEAESASDYGTGFKVVDKATLVGQPFLIIEWRFNDGDFGGRQFVSVAAVTKDDRKVIFNDGGTGVCKQLATVTQQRRDRGHRNPQAGLLVESGLTATSYWFNEDTGETSSQAQSGKGWGPATTYYLAD